MSAEALFIELILSPKNQQAADDLERSWRQRESQKHWDTSDMTLQRIRDWLLCNTPSQT